MAGQLGVLRFPSVDYNTLPRRCPSLETMRSNTLHSGFRWFRRWVSIILVLWIRNCSGSIPTVVHSVPALSRNGLHWEVWKRSLSPDYFMMFGYLIIGQYFKAELEQVVQQFEADSQSMSDLEIEIIPLLCQHLKRRKSLLSLVLRKEFIQWKISF